jgi:hypothetical protein
LKRRPVPVDLMEAVKAALADRGGPFVVACGAPDYFAPGRVCKLPARHEGAHRADGSIGMCDPAVEKPTTKRRAR